MDFGQKIDPSNGLVMPWYTHGALDAITSWDLSEAKVLEWGGGESSLWWASRAREVVTIERKPWWTRSAPNLRLELKEGINEGDAARMDEYIVPPEGYDPDIMIVDDVFRYECILYALSLPRTKTRKLIVDNWQQDYVFICPSAEVALAPWPENVYLQPDHTDHSGHPWQTGIWTIDPDWAITNHYNSHRAALKLALDHTDGAVIELGCGFGSTVSLRDYCRAADRPFGSFETNETWGSRFAGTQIVKNYHLFADLPCGLLFVDSAPGEERKDLISLASHLARVIVVHDTEPGAEYIYGLNKVLSEFKYRMECQVEGYPQTSIVSNYINVMQWIQPR